MRNIVKIEGGAFMRAVTLMPVISIVLALGGYLFPSNYADAGCCAPCTCYAWCWCAGINNCKKYACNRDDSASLQIQAMNSNEKLDVSGTYVSLPASAPILSSLERLIARSISGQCASNNYVLKLFQGPEDTLKLEPDFLTFPVSEDDSMDIGRVALNEGM
jgi:hypothetical protein